jgi:GAF domain-containing protein
MLPPMPFPPRPDNETARLKALLDYRILDTPPEPDFDGLTYLASLICPTPIALISLVDETRQWFKSKVGLDAQETSRDLAFCAHAILDRELMIVPDALADARFHDNPLVREDPHIRFYAGAPITTPEGFTLGTLCVIDRQARDLSPDQKAALRALSRQVLMQLEYRRLVHERDQVLQQAGALAQAHQLLSGLLPICSQCRAIRDSHGSWKSLESYLLDHSDTVLSHGLCPVCTQQMRESLHG